MKIQELINAPEGVTLETSAIITKLKSHRYVKQPDSVVAKAQLDPLKHEVFNRVTRPDKRVRVDPDDIEQQDNVIQVTSSGTDEDIKFRNEPVARIALALQKLIVKRAVSFMFGNPVELDASPESENEKAVLKALKRVMYDNKAKSFNRKVARHLFSCTEVAELWYPVEKKNSVYGFDSKFKLRSAIFSPLNGDTLYPYFDESGDMVAFSREFSTTNSNNITKNFFETYTDEEHTLFEQGPNGMQIVEGYPKELKIGKIPIVYATQPQVEWEDVQILIERLETLLSNFADTNDYHASPKIFLTGEINGFAKKGESGAVIQGDEGATAQYLSWANAPEAVKLEIETLLRMIYTITQTPDISFDAVKGLNVSGIALKLLFMDAHLKVADHQEVFDEYLQRRINIVNAFIGTFNTKLAKDAENLIVEPIITPYMIKDEAAEMKIWSDANGGNAVMSQKASFAKAGMTSDTDADFEQYQTEQTAANTFSINEPTVV